MPLRSVEAATRDDAIAAAHEQFGLSARVVGVRRVRSGGMMGFFATERFVAEVDTDPEPRLPLPAPRTSERRTVPERAAGTPDGPAARRAVPARNAAAAWAAEARPSPARPAAPADRRVDELAGLLTGPPEPARRAPAPYAPVSVPRTPGPATRPAASHPPAVRPAWSELLAGTGATPAASPAPAPAPAVEPVAPSPFTAALARMVAGDRDVQQAVEDAVPRPSWPDPTNDDEMSVPSPGTHQEEEPVELQDWTPSSLPVVDVPAAWTPAEPVVPVAPLASREESIAEVLRTALAQGRSDEALAGMLRTVMDGASPAVALAEPAEPVAVDAEPVVVEPAVIAEEPVLVEPVAVEPVAADPVAEEVAEVLPAPIEAALPEIALPEPVEEELVSVPDVSSDLWGAPVVPAARPAPVVEEPVAEIAAVEEVAEVLVEEPAAEEPAVEEPAVEEIADTPDVIAPVLARTASDPAPLSLDTTSVMPPLALLPPLPSGRRGGRPPVPPSTGRPTAAAARPVPGPPASVALPAPSRPEPLATVTRLPLAPVAGPAAPVVAAPEPVVAPQPVAAPQPDPSDTAVFPAVAAPRAARPQVDRPRPAAPVRAAEPVRRPAGVPQGGLLDRLASLGLPEDSLGGAFTADLAARGTYSALTRLLSTRLPETPEVPAGAGDVLVVVGPGVETLRAARALAASLRLDPDRVQWATRGDLAGLAPAGSRMTTIEGAIDRRHDAVGSGTLTIVAVDAPLRADAYWTAQMLAIWSPAAVWALVEATRKPEDLRPWLEGLPRVDALVVQDTDLSADPAAVLDRVAQPLGLPVAVVDGVRATPHRWASLLCERLETPQA